MGGLSDLQNLATIGKRLDASEKENTKLKIKVEQLENRVVFLERNALTAEDKQNIIDAVVARIGVRNQ